ncbi:MAG: RdgB/HAM1 family non-canonical purine NTP pyrophosphatase [Muribaculaceae bacterium]|nr:RdgB/HAM1 family non-canonical purine NTP pyrophosphatase [Muribaculaceae bacterium]
MSKPTIVFATNNAHKLDEARRLAAGRINILSLKEIDCHDDIPETAPDIEGNSLIKARWVYDKYGYDCFADDTGLFVDALDGAPGVMSARFAGLDATDADNVSLLLDKLKDNDRRDAAFRTVVTLITRGNVHTFEGRVDGHIGTEREGDSGFGYDPVFIPAQTGISFALMTPEEKNTISHRGRALTKLFDFLLR